jgi:hypothetical protein
MKKVNMLCLLLVLVSGVTSQANTLVNGNFDEGPLGSIDAIILPGWTLVPDPGTWWGGNGLHNSDPDRFIGVAAMRFWLGPGPVSMYQNFAATAGTSYIYSAVCKNYSGDLTDHDLQLVATYYDAWGTELVTNTVAVFDSAVHPVNTWVEINGILDAPAGTTSGRITIAMIADGGTKGAVCFDNASVLPVGQAYNPNPANGADVALSLTAFSWTNPAPRNPSDTITCDVYFEENDNDPNFHTAPVASDIAGSSILLADYGIVLQDDTSYTWRVDCTDPNSGGPVTFQGAVWTFQIGDLPPVVNAGADKYLWLNMADGDGDPAKVTFTLTGTYTDDGKSTITRAQWVQGTHEGGGTVTIVSQTEVVPGTVQAVVSATNTGWLDLRFEVQDAVTTSIDAMNVGVYSTCAQAALEDPTDTTMETLWPDGITGDINGDCKTDLEDLAIVASSWVQCMSVKAGCNP